MNGSKNTLTGITIFLSFNRSSFVIPPRISSKSLICKKATLTASPFGKRGFEKRYANPSESNVFEARKVFFSLIFQATKIQPISLQFL